MLSQNQALYEDFAKNTYKIKLVDSPLSKQCNNLDRRERLEVEYDLDKVLFFEKFLRFDFALNICEYRRYFFEGLAICLLAYELCIASANSGQFACFFS